MTLSREQLKSVVHGAYEWHTEDGYFAFCRFSDEQTERLKFDDFYFLRTRFTAGISAELTTDAKEIRFRFRRIAGTQKDSVDVYVNNTLQTAFLMENLQREGELRIALPAGENEVAIYFPTDVEFQIKDFSVDGIWRSAPPKRERVLWIGDSITQGVGSFRGGQTFVNLVSRALGYESLNQGIGGYRHYDCAVMPLARFRPDKIVVALGTNDDAVGLHERVSVFYRALHLAFGDTPVLTITPIWRGDDVRRAKGLEEIKGVIESVCAQYSNIRTVNGFGLVPPDPDCFRDNLHPNVRGMGRYATALIAKIQELNF